MGPPNQSQPAPRRPQAAVRLIFAYDGDEIRLLSRTRLQMTLPATGEVDVADNQSGFWAEVRQADEQVLFRQPLHDPIRRDVEVFSDDPDRSVSRAPAERAEGAFTVVVPDYAEADHIAFLGGAPGPPGLREQGSRELARFPLRPGEPPGDEGRS
jgi:hypothetical protein